MFMAKLGVGEGGIVVIKTPRTFYAFFDEVFEAIQGGKIASLIIFFCGIMGNTQDYQTRKPCFETLLDMFFVLHHGQCQEAKVKLRMGQSWTA